MSAASVDEVTEGLNLSESELAAIAYVREQIVVASKTNLLCIDGMDVNARQLDCLVRHVRGWTVKMVMYLDNDLICKDAQL